MLWCPSDGTINGLRFFEVQAGWDGTTVPITYGNYAGMMGTYNPERRQRFPDRRGTGARERHVPRRRGAAVGSTPADSGATRPPVKIAAITDGTSNTIAFAETAHGKFEQYNCGPAAAATGK